MSTTHVQERERRTRLRQRRIRRDKGAAFLFVLPIAIFVAVFFLYPIVRTGHLSFLDYTFQSYFSGEADFVGVQNYVTIFGHPLFPKVLLNTALFTVISLTVQFVVGLGLALFFYKKFPLSGFLRALLLIPWLLPVIVSATVWRWMFYKDTGIINWTLGTDIGWISDPKWSIIAVIIANIWLGIPFNLVLLYGGLQAIPESLYEAAEIDGAGPWRRFWSITWPLLRPVTIVTVLLGLVYTIKAFDIIWVITEGGPVDSSQTLATWSYKLSFEGGPGQSLSLGATVASLLFILALILGLLYVRSQREGKDS